MHRLKILILFFIIPAVYSQGFSSIDIGGFYLNNTVDDTIKSDFKNLGSIKFTIANEFHKFLGQSNFFVGAGYNVQFGQFRFTDNTTFYRRSDSVFFTIDNTPSRDYVYSKLKTVFLQIPLLVGFSKGKFLIEAGGFGGILIGSKKDEKYIQSYNNIDSDYIVKSTLEGKKETAVNLLQYGVFARIAYKKVIGLYTRYSLSPLFDKSRLASQKYKDINFIEFGISFMIPRKKKSSWKNFPNNEKHEKTSNT